MPKKKDFYCGTARKVPDEYERHGTRYECLKRGYGAGMYSKQEFKLPKSKKSKKQQLEDAFKTLALLLKIKK